MFRIDDATAATSLPTPETAGTEGYFTEGNPTAGTPATNVRGSWLNMIQEELCAVLAAAGITRSKTTYNQVNSALQKMYGSVVGTVRNLSMSITAASASATLASDLIVVTSALGAQTYILPSFSKTINLATTGAGGMDTGTAPVSGFVALYAIYNPTTGASALLATNATSSKVAEVYGGANMPSGYTASALIAVWPTNASGQFVAGYQKDRRFWYSAGVSILNATTVSTTYTSVSATCLPFNAKLGVGYMGITGSSSAQVYGSYMAADSSGGAQDLSSIYAVSGSVASYGEWTIPIQTAQTIFYKNSLTSGATFSVVCRGYEI
ncbi:hypothetical protein [Caballeronia sp. AZ7_KS35]|uniref:hypothetical protein n=1 Tax=Caballeronia sp. AZ7_KS35 TaxID=2921762 RepID=UPI00202871A7|nr:hypothetical protein [Caballeronia sp. AZ7_KS35]